MIGNQKIVNIFDYQEQNEEKFNEINERMHKSGVISQFYGALINPTTRLVNSIVYAAVGIFWSISSIKWFIYSRYSFKLFNIC